MKIYNSIAELVGKTPILRLKNIENNSGVKACILAKLECFNPAGRAKDRPALEMLRSAEKLGVLKKGSVIIEPTSGNTGIGLSAIGVSEGYRVIIVMPDSMSEERIKLMKLYGAEVILVHDYGNIGLCIEECLALAMRMKAEDPHVFVPQQFENPANAEAHRKTTGPEIFEDTDGDHSWGCWDIYVRHALDYLLK